MIYYSFTELYYTPPVLRYKQSRVHGKRYDGNGEPIMNDDYEAYYDSTVETQDEHQESLNKERKKLRKKRLRRAELFMEFIRTLGAVCTILNLLLLLNLNVFGKIPITFLRRQDHDIEHTSEVQPD